MFDMSVLAPPSPHEEPVTRYSVFEFTGDGREYFKIWIFDIDLAV